MLYLTFEHQQENSSSRIFGISLSYNSERKIPQNADFCDKNIVCAVRQLN